MLRNCLSALLNSLSNNFSGEKDSPKRKRQKAVSYSRSLRFEPCEDRTMLSVSPFNSEDVTAYWTFNNNTEDTNGAFIGSLNNGASLTTNGIAGGGLSLDGVDDYFSIGNPEELQILNEITLAAWIVPETASGVQNIIAKGYSTHPNGEIFLRIANGKYQVGSWTGSEHLAEFVIPSSDIGERVHLAGTYDGTTWRLYRNGVEIASTVDNTGAVEVDGAWAVGARGTGTERFYSGVIDEVVISSTAYTAQEIAALASIPTNAQEDNSVTWNWSDVQSGELYSEQGDSLGTLSNGAYIQTDLNYGQVLNLSGNNGYVSLGNPDDLQIFGKITLSAWICPDSLTGIQNIIVKGYASNPDGEIFLRIANGEYQVGSWNGTNNYVSAIADTDDIGQWIQLTGVYDGNTWRLYKNCVEVASTSSSVGAVPVNANWTIGSSASGTDRFFNGKIGAGGIYDHALDAQSVATLMSDNQTTARVGGNHYAIKGQSYQLQLDASDPDVLWTINWGDGTTNYYYNVSSASHVFANSGTASVSVTAKQNGRTIDVAGSSIALQIGADGNMVTNGDFEDVEFQTNETWIVSNDVTGWSGRIEIQGSGGNKIAELDTDNRTSSLDQNPGDDQPHHTTITSDSMTFIPGLTYTLSFDAWNRSDYTQDNVLSVTIPGSIVKINGTSKADLLDLIDDNANLSEEDNIYAYTSISTSSVTFSAGGTTYKVSDGEGGTTDVSGASPFHVSSITFVATSNSGSVSFSDVSSDVIPGYGPLLDNISMNQEYLYVDIDVDSNNDGVINAFDDPVEMAPNGGKILAVGYGQCKPINLSVHTNQTNLASDNIVYQLEYDNSKILLYNTESLPQAVYGTEIDISPYYIAPNTDLPNGFLTLNGNAKTIYVDGFVLGETTVTLKAYSVYSNSSGNIVRELISSDVVKLNVGFDLDTDSNNNSFVNSNDNFELTDGKLSVKSYVEDMIENLPGFGKKIYLNDPAVSQVSISTSEFVIPSGYKLQLLVSGGLEVYSSINKEPFIGLNVIENSDFREFSYTENPGNITFYVEGTSLGERHIYLRLVGIDNDEMILARDTINFQCVFNIDLLADTTNNGNLDDTKDNFYEDDDRYAGFIVPYRNENSPEGESVYTVSKSKITVTVSDRPYDISKRYYIRLCQTNASGETLQVLGVYQLSNNMFSYNDQTRTYTFNNLDIIAAPSLQGKSSYETWVRLELYASNPGSYDSPSLNKGILTLSVQDPTSLQVQNENISADLCGFDMIKMTATLFVMDRHTTYVDNDAKYAGMTDSQKATAKQYKWICDLEKGTYQTPQTNGQIIDYTNPEAAVPVNNNNNNNNNDLITGVTYLRSALDYAATGVTMNIGYEFLHKNYDNNSLSYGDEYGYVKPTGKEEKLSFVANGGIKLGSKDGYGDNVFEIALIDFHAMIDRVLDRMNLKSTTENNVIINWQGLDECIFFNTNGEIYFGIPNQDPQNNQNQQWLSGELETLSCLLNKFGYGQSYSDITQRLFDSNELNNPSTRIAYIRNFIMNLYMEETTSGTFTLILTPESQSNNNSNNTDPSNYSNVAVKVGNEYYFNTNVFHPKPKFNSNTLPATTAIDSGNGHIYLQSHWGSGVIYTINPNLEN